MLRFLVVLAVILLVEGIQFQFDNKEAGPVWVGIQGNNGKPHLNNGGFVLDQGASRTINAPDDWAGRFWGRTYCDPNTKHCLTGDCGNKIECAGAGGTPPASLAEITLKGDGGLDYYDVSLVDGFNLRISFEPIGGEGNGGQYSCKKTACLVDLNQECPNELRVNYEGRVIGCKSACLAFNTDQYCCRGAYDTSATCKASDWPTNYPKYFKDRCPDAYSYAYDDHKSTFTCKNVPKYLITFGN